MNDRKTWRNRASHARIHGRNRRTLEPLEARLLLTGSAVFAELNGTLSPSAPTEQIALTIAPANFQLPTGSALFGFEVHAAADGPLDPTAIRIQTSSGAIVTPSFLKTEVGGQHSSVTVANLPYGSYVVTASGLNGTTGDLKIDVFLVGDANGDHNVGPDDGVLIRSLQGATAASPNYSRGADANLDGQITSFDYALWARNQGDSTTVVPMSLNDGFDPPATVLLDGTYVTNAANVTLSGNTEPNATVTISPESAADVVTSADAEGHFSAALTLQSGANTLAISSNDIFGQHRSNSLAINVDDTPPISPDFHAVADTTTVGASTTFRNVSLVGSTDPYVSVTLGLSGPTVVAGIDGTFTIPNVVLALGDNVLSLTATDAIGNSSTSTKTITRNEPNSPNQVVLDWNNAALAAIQLNASTPEYASRALAITQAAVYDAVNSVDGASSYLYVHVAAPAGSSDIAAAAQAAHDALVYLYPAQQPTFDALLTTSLGQVGDPVSKSNGRGVGQLVATSIIAQRANDGATDYVAYTPGTGPGVWQPTYPSYMPAENPQWATLQPFLMTSGSQFRPAGPPALSSAQWENDYNQVMSIGAINSTTRTTDETQIARFWNDPTGTATPPGHWNIIADVVAADKQLSLADTAKMLAELNVAMGDAAIVAWDVKYADNFWRPITAIQTGGGNADLTADVNWHPLLNTPPFPEYISGHSTFSSAAASVLDAVFGANTSFTVGSTSPGMAGVTRSYTGFDQAANEAAMSRIYAGIHFNTSVQDGLTAGTALGQYVVQKFADDTDTTPPVVVFASTNQPVIQDNTTIVGTATDNLSGIASLQGQFDSGPNFNIPVNANGQFSLATGLAIDGTADSLHTLHLTATDYSGNVSASYDYSFTLDTQAPVLTVTSPAVDEVLVLGATLTGGVDGTGSAITGLSYSFDAGTAIPVSFSPADGSFNQSLDLSKLSTGAHTLHVTTTDSAGNTATVAINLTLPTLAPLTVSNFTPSAGSSDLGATYRPEVFFSRPIDTATLNSNDFYLTDSTGAKVPTTIVPADDGTYAWLFPVIAMPGASTMTVSVDGTQIRATDGTYLDANATGSLLGSKLTYSFSTVSTALLPSTSLSGILADPGPDLKPGTKDDVVAGSNGLGSANDTYKLPIAGVTVSIVGTSLTTITDSHGRFSFASIPAGDMKLEVDGTTATGAPAGYYFPQMVMDLNVLPGVANTVMAAMMGTGSGNAQPGADQPAALGVYLPRVATSILQTVNPIGTTHIGVDAISAPDLTNQQRQKLSIDVPGGVAVGMNGQKLSNVQVGISVVPPQLVMDMLPPGVMQHTFDITVQAPGVATFSTPVAMTFPNVFDAAPGTKLNFLSFDHTTGRLVIEGTATVSADGLSVDTDPGTGITHPGWHGLTPLGGLLDFASSIYQACAEPNCDCTAIALDVGSIAATAVGFGAAALAAPEVAIVSGLVGLGFGVAQLAHEVSIDNINGWLDSVISTTFGIFEGKTSAGGLAQLVRDSGFSTADGRSKLFRELSSSLKADFRAAGHLFDLFGAILSAQDLRDKLAECADGSDTVQASTPTSALDTLINQLDATSQEIFDAINPLISESLLQLIPQNQGILPVASDGVLTAIALDGASFIDTATGKPLRVQTSTLINPSWYSNSQFQQSAIGNITNALQSMAAILSNSNPVLNAAANEIQSIYDAGRVHYLTEVIATPAVSAPYYLAVDLSTGSIIGQGRTSDASFSLFVPANVTISLEVVDPDTGYYGREIINEGTSGSITNIGSIILSPDVSGDRDGDGIGNLSERVVGTNPLLMDSNGDGISDGTELTEGLDPLSGIAFPTGVIGNLPLQGIAKAVDVEGLTTSGRADCLRRHRQLRAGHRQCQSIQPANRYQPACASWRRCH